jgi:FkbM family methyltransferase
MVQEKTISINGFSARIFGSPDDHYFANIDGGAIATLNEAIARTKKHAETVWIDAGANCGLTALAMSRANPHGTVFAYEPLPAIFDNLSETISANAIRNIVPMRTALGATEGELCLYPGGPINFSRSSGSHVWTPGHWKPRDLCIEVPVTTIDRELETRAWRDVSFIKIDVEGFEEDVIRGAANTLARFSPLVFLEFNSWCLIAIANKNPRGFLEFLRRTFRHIYRFDDASRLSELATADDLIGFLHTNLTAHGCVDDLLCTDHPIPL